MLSGLSAAVPAEFFKATQGAIVQDASLRTSIFSGIAFTYSVKVTLKTFNSTGYLVWRHRRDR